MRLKPRTIPVTQLINSEKHIMYYLSDFGDRPDGSRWKRNLESPETNRFSVRGTSSAFDEKSYWGVGGVERNKIAYTMNRWVYFLVLFFFFAVFTDVVLPSGSRARVIGGRRPEKKMRKNVCAFNIISTAWIGFPSVLRRRRGAKKKRMKKKTKRKKPYLLWRFKCQNLIHPPGRRTWTPTFSAGLSTSHFGRHKSNDLRTSPR